MLDEPTDGVDPEGRRDIREVLVRLRSQGKTVFVNSHLLGELEMVCDRVAILVAGRVARQGTLDELTVAKQRYEIEVVADATSSRALQAVVAGRVQPGRFVEIHGPVLRFGTTDPVEVQPLLDAVRAAGLVVRRVQMFRPSLEELFMDALASHAAGGPR